MTTGCSTDFECATNDANKNTCVPKGACGTDPVTCSKTGTTCDSSTGNICGDGYGCANAPAEKKDKCVPKAQCGTKVDGDTAKTECWEPAKPTTCDPTKLVDGCDATKERCQVLPAAGKNTCIPTANCGTGTGDAKI